ncbi:MAG: ATP-binding protein [Acidobacteria bacterium]|jgi:signal transduction histidine kinase/ligand-binding sensor domain-containing protein|nr:ATP-binding protein [Acidobacteriota bacterium]
MAGAGHGNGRKGGWARTGALAVLAVLAALVPRSSMALVPDRPLSWAQLTRYTVREGLPSNAVSDLAQDAAGFLWVGTEEGVARFDGARFVVYRSPSAPGLPSSFVRRLLATPDGSVFVGTTAGLARFRDGRFAALAFPEGGPDANVSALARAPDGRVLVAFRDRVGAVEGDRLAPLGTAPGGVNELAADGAGRVFALLDNGRRVAVLADGNWTVLEAALAADERIGTLAADRDGTVWAATGSGRLLRAEGLSWTEVSWRWSAGPDDAARIAPATPDGLWLATLSGRLVRAGARGVESLPLAPGGAQLNAVLEDRDGNLWAAAGGAGLLRLRDAPVVTLGAREGWPGDAMAAVYADRSGRIWLGPQPGGLKRLDDGGWRDLSLGPGATQPPVLSIVEDADGSTWLGTAFAGLFRAGPDDRVARVPGAPAELYLWLAASPRDRAIRAAASGGPLVLVDGRADRAPLPEGGAAPTATLVDRQGRWWVGTAGAGLLLRDGEGWRNAAPGLPVPPYFTALREDDGGTVWAATVGAGLWRVAGPDPAAPGPPAAIGTAQGLPTDTIYDALDDGRGALWLSTPRGIVRVARDELLAAAEGRAATVRAQLLSIDDGLAAGECNGGGHAAARTPDGRLLFATPAGIALVEPGRAFGPAAAPAAAIEELTCDGTAIELAGGAAPRLPAGTLRCEVRYTAPALGAPERVVFSYRMSRLDDGLVAAGAARSATYTHLPPGEHVFEVVAADRDGAWRSAPAAVRFSVEPHPWQTAWLWALAALGAAALAYAGFRGRVRRLLAHQRELEQAVAARTAELAETNRTLEQRVDQGIERLRGAERMAAYGEMVAGVAHEVRHPIFSLRSAAYLIAHKAGPLKDELAQPLAALDRETTRMTRLMDDLLHFARPPALQRAPAAVRPLLEAAGQTVRDAGGWDELRIEIDAPADLPEVPLDRDRMLQVLVNLLENARKHASGVTRVRLVARAVPHAIELEVENDGAGMGPGVREQVFEPFFTRGSGTGLGLAIVRRIVTDHGGTIVVDSAPESGTRFTIRLPRE